MPYPKPCLILFLVAFFYGPPQAHALEVFAKGTGSRNYLASDSWEENISATAGFAFTLFSTVRFEARYTNTTSLQNTLAVVGSSAVGTLNNILTETDNLSTGLDIAFTSDKAAVQPYLYVGVGYIVSQRSYYFEPVGASQSIYVSEPKQQGITGNVGLGFRIFVARHIALEVEAFAYAMDITEKNPLINFSGTAGLRIFI